MAPGGSLGRVACERDGRRVGMSRVGRVDARASLVGRSGHRCRRSASWPAAGLDFE